MILIPCYKFAKRPFRKNLRIPFRGGIVYTTPDSGNALKHHGIYNHPDSFTNGYYTRLKANQ